MPAINISDFIFYGEEKTTNFDNGFSATNFGDT